MTRRATTILALLFLAAGCAMRGTRGSGVGTTASRANVITLQELSEHPELTTVADAVRRLRPTWREVPIIIGNEPYAGSSRDISLTFVKELRFVDLSEAQMRWGQSIRTPILHVIRR